MIHLLDYICENLMIEETKSAEELLKTLSKNQKLADYVDDLNKMLKDKDAKQVLANAFVYYKGKDAIDLDGEIKFINVKELHPTQNEIDVNNSIAWPFKNEKNAKDNMEQIFNNSDKVSFGFPLVTFEGKYILDGHHRWSQAYAFNPDCKMKCFNIKQSSGPDLTTQEALKLCQGVLAAKRASDRKGNIPKEEVYGANVFKMSEEDIKKTIKEYCEKNEEVAAIIQKYAKVDTTDALAEKIFTNLMDLRKKNEKFANKGNVRGVMPQTDKGGDNPNKKGDETAAYDKKGSALYAMTNGKMDPKTVKQK